MIAILFDIDGTLLQTGGAGRIAFADTFRDLFGIDPITSQVSFAGRSDRAIAHELMEVHGLESSNENWCAFVEAFLPRLRAALLQTEGSVLPGVLKLLDELDQLDEVLVGLLTGNIAEGAKAKLSRYDIFERFLFGGFGDDHLSRDDIAASALAAAVAYSLRNHNFELPPERVIVIGDTPADVECARAIGAVAVAVATGGATLEQLEAAQPDLLLDDLDNPETILALIRDDIGQESVA